MACCRLGDCLCVCLDVNLRHFFVWMSAELSFSEVFEFLRYLLPFQPVLLANDSLRSDLHPRISHFELVIADVHLKVTAF